MKRFLPVIIGLLLVAISCVIIHWEHIFPLKVVEVVPEYTWVKNPPVGQTFKITCFTGYECQTPECQSGEIEIGDVALNPKWGEKKLVHIPELGVYNADWIASGDTDIDIWFGDSYKDYLKCLEFGVLYSEAKVYPVEVQRR